MNSKIIHCLSVFVFACLLFSSAALAEKPAIPSDGQRLFILGQDKTSIENYMADTELPRPHGFTTYTTLTRGATESVTNYCFKGLDGLKDLNNYNSNSAVGCNDSERRNQWGSGIQNAQWVIETFQPSIVAIGMFCPGNAEASGLYQNGTHDDLLTELADFFKFYQGTQFLLRTCYEFNGDAHGLSFSSFTGIFKYIRTYLDGQGVTNVAHVWQSDAYHGTGRVTSALGNTEQGYWPGKQYVDWVGVSQFASDINEEASIAEAEGLPLFIAEVAPHGALGTQYDFSLPFNTSVARAVGQSNPVTAVNNLNWFNEKNAEIMRTSTKAWAYINADWTAQPQWENAVDQAGANFFKYTDSRVQQSAEVKSYFIGLVQESNGFILDENTVPVNLGPAISQCAFDNTSPVAQGEDVVFSCQILASAQSIASVSLSVNGSNYNDQNLGDGLYTWQILADDLVVGSNMVLISAVDSAGATNTQTAGLEVIDDSAGQTPLAEQGIVVDGANATIYFKDQGWSANWNYICLNNSCISGTRVANQLQRVISGNAIVAGNSYDIQLKVQDSATGQYISPTYTVVAAEQGTAPPVDTPPEQPPVNNPPSLAIATPSGLIAGDSTTITVTATDSDGSIINTLLYVTAPNSAEQLVGSDAQAPFQFTIDNLAAGSYNLRAVAIDDDNDVSETTATFTVEQAASPEPPPSSSADYGIELNGNSAVLFFKDQGWSGNWNYLCVNSNCIPGSKNGDRWQRDISNLSVSAGDTFTIQLKIQDNSTGQYISPEYTVVVGANNGDEPPVDEPPVDEPPVDDPPVDEPPVDEPPVDEPPVDEPPVDDPPVQQNTPPTIAVNVPSGLTEADNATVLINAADNDGYVVNVALYVTAPNSAEQLLAVDNAAPYQFTLTNLMAGSYFLRAMATDDDGAQSQATATFVVDAATDDGDAGDNGGGSADFSNLDWTSNSLTEHNVGPAPRANPPRALASPTTGAQPTSHGFAFDLVGNTITWRWGPSIIKQAGDSGLEIHCSMDDNATFIKAYVVNSQVTVPCSGDYNYFFRYLHPSALNDDPASQWVSTGLFTTEGARVDPRNYTPFVDGSANWMRFRHPVTQDGTTAAVLDAQHNNDLLRNLDRYTIWVEDSPGNVEFKGQINGSVLRNEAMRLPGSPNGQQFFGALSSGMGFGDLFSYGQVISFELTAVAGATGAQTYNDFSHYVVGCGWCGKYGDPRLNSAGKASTSQEFSDSGGYIDLEHNAIFTQPLVTIHKEDMIDDFILGHHLFHGVDPNKTRSSTFDDPDVQIGQATCGSCHFRDGRGSEVFNTPKGPRIAPPIYGLSLLDHMVGREAGYTWDGSVPDISQQVVNALRDDHQVDAAQLPGRVLELLTSYVELLTVPSRNPGSYDKPGVAEGDVLFNQIGCAGCHTPVQQTSSDAPTHLRDIEIRPYTDMKVHNLGNGSFRTPPLWGLGQNLHILERNNRAVLYMHDGSAQTIEQAILAHGGDASAVTTQYNQLSSAEKLAIQNFVKTL